MLFERQAYQDECVENIMKVLQFTDNLRDLSNLKEGIKGLHKEKDIPIATIQDDCRLDVLMETGTGKTFTYLKTMYEMNKRYGINKFVIFVPRLAIRSGIIQNIDLTSNHFFQDYSKRLEKYTYEGNLGSIRNYISGTHELSVLILTSASIAPRSSSGNKSTRILTRKDNETSLWPNLSRLEAVNKLKPVVFLDEPHLLKGDSFVKAYKDHFSDSLLIRFGATYPDEEASRLSNVVYVLDSITSLRSHLVKKIRVSTFTDSRFVFRLSKIKSSKEVDISYPFQNTEKIIPVCVGDDIGAKTGNTDFAGIHITKVQKAKGQIHLSNRTSVNLSDYTLVDETIREMVRGTISRHFEKERIFFDRGIKVLSLFFIPGINDFRGDNPRIKKIFEEEYKVQRDKVIADEISKEYKDYLEKDFKEGELCIHEGYFSGDNDSDEKIRKEVDKILNKKTEMLSTKEPLRFIFSVWALQEGWDNPNIFNICKLSSTNRDTSRRQQVGRGLRIAVDTNGVRQTLKKCEENNTDFYEVNMLDMFVSGQEGDFIRDIQDEIMSKSFGFGGNIITQEMLEPLLDKREAMVMMNFLHANGAIEFSTQENAWIVQDISLHDFIIENKDILPDILVSKYDKILKLFSKFSSSIVENANNPPEEVTIRQDHMKEFNELWKTITRKAKIVYRDIQEDRLIDAISKKFNEENIKKVHVRKRVDVYDHEKGEIEAEEDKILDAINFFNERNRYSRFIFNFARRSKHQLPLPFIMRLFAKLDASNIKNDPKYAEQILSKIINDEVHRSIIESVGYEFNGTISIDSQDAFYDDAGNPRKKIKGSLLGQYGSDEQPSDRYLYDKIRYDSGIEKKASMKTEARKINAGEIRVFAKLPRISIPTPYRYYNPDFAYYIRTAEDKKIFFVVETKGYDSENAIPEDERNNIAYAKKFFEQLNKEVGDDIRVMFEQRINRQNLSDLLQEIGGDYDR